MKNLLLLISAIVLTPTLSFGQLIISADMGNNGTLSSTDTLGLVPADNWTNPSGFPNFSDAALKFDDGTSSGATLTAEGSNGNTNSQVTATTTPDYEMFNRTWRLSGDPLAQPSLTFNSLPTSGDWAGGYDIYVYVVGIVEDPLLYSATDGTTTYYLDLASGNNFSGSYQQVTSTDSLNPSTTGNYFLFSGLSGASQTITFTGNSGNNHTLGVAGVQIVQIPEPSAGALLMLGALGLLSIVRRRRGA